jgi:hypothetical protein
MAVGHLITNRMRLVKGFLLPLLLLSLMLMTEGWLVRSIVAKKTWTARRVEPYCRTRDNPILAPPLARRDGLALGVAMLRLQLLCRPLCRTKRSRIWQDTSRESLDCDRGNSAHGERRSEKEGLIRLLFSTSDSSDDAPITSSSSSTPPPLTSGDSQPAPASPQIEPSRERCSLYYRSGRFLFGLAGLALLLMPDRTLTTLLAAKWGGAAGFLVAAGLCHVLDDANCHGSRLGSNTYKRLGLGLMGFFVIGLFAVPGEAAFLTDAVPAIALSALMTLLRAFGCAVAYQGWKRGVLLSEGSSSWTPGVVAGELAKGTKETLRGLRVQSRKKALTYRNCFLLVSLGIFSSVMEGLFNIEVRFGKSARCYQTPHVRRACLCCAFR